MVNLLLLLQTQKLSLTSVVVQLPAWIAAVLGQAVLTHALAGGLVHDLVGPAERQQARVLLHLCKQQKRLGSSNLCFVFPPRFSAPPATSPLL